MEDESASEQIDDIITKYGGWKGKTLAHLRSVILQAGPEIIEEVKWKMPSRPEGLPVWSHNGIVCLAETFKDNIKLVFPKGVWIDDPQRLFNARLKSKTDRAIAFHEGDIVPEAALIALVERAVGVNKQKKRGSKHLI